MNNISIELAQEFAITTGVTILIITFVVAWVSMFVISGLKLMFRIMDKIEKGNRAFGPKDRPVTEPIKEMNEHE